MQRKRMRSHTHANIVANLLSLPTLAYTQAQPGLRRALEMRSSSFSLLSSSSNNNINNNNSGNNNNNSGNLRRARSFVGSISLLNEKSEGTPSKKGGSSSARGSPGREVGTLAGACAHTLDHSSAASNTELCSSASNNKKVCVRVCVLVGAHVCVGEIMCKCPQRLLCCPVHMVYVLHGG